MDELIAALRRALRAQDSERIEELMLDPLYPQITAKGLDTILELAPFLRDEKIITALALHPQFSQLSPPTIFEMLLVPIRLGYENAIDAILSHANLKDISTDLVHRLIERALEFQGRKVINQLKQTPHFSHLLHQHLKEMILSAIRTHHREWLKHLLEDPRYPEVSSQVFGDLMRWALLRQDQELIDLAISHQSFNEKVEMILIQELTIAALTKKRSQMQPIETYIVDQLMHHPNISTFSPKLLCWLTDQAISLQQEEIFKQLALHPQWEHISENSLVNLFISAIRFKDREALRVLLDHPHLKEIPGEGLGLILEEAIQSEYQTILHLIIHHPHFIDIPEDIFKRVATMELQGSNDVLRQRFLKELNFQIKYDRMIYEAIRRNESELIAQFFKDPRLQYRVIEQLINYMQADPLFINLYVIRDVLREAFLTRDPELISYLANHLLFKERVIELMHQAIQFDDDLLIESMLLDPVLKAPFKAVISKAPVEDRQRLFHIFSSQAQFNQKPEEFIKEVLSWQNSG